MSVKTAIIAPLKVAMMAIARQSTYLSLNAPRIPCRPGCSACCKRYVVVSLAEAMVLVDHLKSNQKWARVAATAAEQRDLALKVKPLSWFKMEISCPLLNHDRCDAYAVRPPICSSHFVTSPPEACSPMSTSMARYEPHHMPEVHAEFAKSFDKIIGEKSPLRVRAPMPTALLIAEKISMDYGSDFDSMVSALVREFGA